MTNGIGNVESPSLDGTHPHTWWIVHSCEWTSHNNACDRWAIHIHSLCILNAWLMASIKWTDDGWCGTCHPPLIMRDFMMLWHSHAWKFKLLNGIENSICNAPFICFWNHQHLTQKTGEISREEEEKHKRDWARRWQQMRVCDNGSPIHAAQLIHTFGVQMQTMLTSMTG